MPTFKVWGDEEQGETEKELKVGEKQPCVGCRKRREKQVFQREESSQLKRMLQMGPGNEN